MQTALATCPYCNANSGISGSAFLANFVCLFLALRLSFATSGQTDGFAFSNFELS